MYTYAFTPLPYSLPKPKGDRIASFCSGGDLGFSLQSQYGISVDLLSIDEFHSAYMDIKRYAYCNLKESGFKTLMGLNQAGRRVFLYHQIRERLLESSQIYFNRNESMLRTGLCQQFTYETYLQQAMPFRPRSSSLLFPIWMDTLGSRLHWIPFRKFRQQWREEITNMEDWQKNPRHFRWTFLDQNRIRLVSTWNYLYSDIYLFEPSTELILESIQFLNRSGNLWVWSWKKLKYLNFRKEEKVRGSPFHPPLFLRRNLM
jgi:hypothetical protein